MSPEQRQNGYLWFYVQHSDFALLMDLMDGLNLGAEHISLEAAILQQLISRNTLGHGFIGDEIVFLPIGLILTLGSGGVCMEVAKNSQKDKLGYSAIRLKWKERRLWVYLRGAG